MEVRDGNGKNSRVHLAQPTYVWQWRKENFIDKVDNILYQLNKICRKLFASHVIYKLTLKKLCAKLFKRFGNGSSTDGGIGRGADVCGPVYDDEEEGGGAIGATD